MNPSRFRPDANFKPGFIATTNDGELSACRFGGSAWSATGSRPDLGDPTLLVTVDLGTSGLNEAVNSECDLEIPLLSYINLTGIIPLQEYQINHDTRTAMFRPFTVDVGLLPVRDQLKTPFPESRLKLRQMRENEIPVDEKSYWLAVDSFLGGEAPIRLCGSPVYIDNIVSYDGFRYFASIGYEGRDHSDGLLGDQAFFIGEIAYYYFISGDWRTVRVVSQVS